METKERFIKFLKTKKMGQTFFEESAGLSRGSISQKNGFTSKSIEKIAAACPDLNLNWLFTGEGDMIKPQHEQIVEPQPALISTAGDTPEASILYHIYNDTINRMKELVEENTKLKMQVTELSEGSEELAKTLKSFHDSNKELADENQQLRIEVMIKDSQLKEKEKSVLDYKELLKKAI
jgi:FtsZ-binding cell division protein ZapB|nr:MAG TPA: LAMBDA REPRESSOR/DNA COMPLEX-DNA COMPLEX, DOUBLE HELIX, TRANSCRIPTION-DNA.8A [Caudoviricetes sp.]